MILNIYFNNEPNIFNVRAYLTKYIYAPFLLCYDFVY